MEFSHKPVLLEETIIGLNIKEDGIYVDCTLGGGGHTSVISKNCPLGKVISIDQDIEAINNFKLNYSELTNVCLLYTSPSPRD